MVHSQLYIWNERFVYTSPKHNEGPSARYTATILAAVGDHKIEIGFEDETEEVGEALLIAPHVARSFRCAGPFISINYDPQSYEHHLLVVHLRGRRCTRINFCSEQMREEMKLLMQGNLDCAEAVRLTADMASCAVPERPEPPRIDLRILSVAHRIKAELPNAPSVDSLAEFAGISPDWLGHLFTEQMGVSMKSYMVWAKMRRAAILLGRRDSLAHVAAEVGFADAAHLTRSFKRFFGLPPSYLGDATRVSTHFCET